jgi:hypothetical protein
MKFYSMHVNNNKLFIIIIVVTITWDILLSAKVVMYFTKSEFDLKIVPALLEVWQPEVLKVN